MNGKLKEIGDLQLLHRTIADRFPAVRVAGDIPNRNGTVVINRCPSPGEVHPDVVRAAESLGIPLRAVTA